MNDAVIPVGERANLTVAQVDALIADRARYRAVAREVVQWDSWTPGPNKTAGMDALVNNAKNALASESKP